MSAPLSAAESTPMNLSTPPLAPTVAAPILNEAFNDIRTLSDWTQVNHSAPPGQSWFQGNPGVFEAQSGGADAYIAANFLSAQDGTGTIDSWLITPLLQLTGATEFTFWTRAACATAPGQSLELRFCAGDGLATDDFDSVLMTVGGAIPYPADWQRCRAALMHAGGARFAFRYLCDAGVADHIGIDSVQVRALPAAPP
jgi:hypothetical protein